MKFNVATVEDRPLGAIATPFIQSLQLVLDLTETDRCNVAAGRT